MTSILIVIGQATLKALGILGLDLLMGKTLKVILYRGMLRVVQWTPTKVDDEILEDIRKDWGLTDADIHPSIEDKK